jgi:hypothetical protein
MTNFYGVYNMTKEQFKEELRLLNDKVVNFPPPKPSKQTRTYLKSSRGEKPTFTSRSR